MSDIQIETGGFPARNLTTANAALWVTLPPDISGGRINRAGVERLVYRREADVENMITNTFADPERVILLLDPQGLDPWGVPEVLATTRNGRSFNGIYGQPVYSALPVRPDQKAMISTLLTQQTGCASVQDLLLFAQKAYLLSSLHDLQKVPWGGEIKLITAADQAPPAVGSWVLRACVASAYFPHGGTVELGGIYEMPTPTQQVTWYRQGEEGSLRVSRSTALDGSRVHIEAVIMHSSGNQDLQLRFIADSRQTPVETFSAILHNMHGSRSNSLLAQEKVEARSYSTNLRLSAQALVRYLTTCHDLAEITSDITGFYIDIADIIKALV